MEVNSLTINKVFSSGGDIQFILPHFQREYAWEKSNWQTLLDDVMGIYELENLNGEPEHFMGAMVVIADGHRSGTMPAFKLVDGQQRLTTVSLFLCALARVIDPDSSLHRKIIKLLINPDEDNLLHYKIVPTMKYGDRQAYMAIISGQEPPNVESRIIGAFEYFEKQLRNKITRDKVDPERLFMVVGQYMHVVFINLNQRERPYEIFESLNAKGKPLTQPDLVRNYIAMRLPGEMQAEIFEKYWVEIEDALRENRTVSRTGELSAFLRHYLAFRTGTLANKDHVYARFRDRIEGQFETPDKFSEEIKTLYRFAQYYDRLLRPEHEPDKQIRYALERLNVLESFTAYPFLLAIYEYYDLGQIGKDEFVEGLAVLENYLVRRYLAGEPSNYMNKMFPSLAREIGRNQFVESLRRSLLTKNYPSDNRLFQILSTQPIYDTRRPQRLVLILETINRSLSSGSGGHTVLDGDATIEHIMPQTLNDEWKSHLGDEWSDAHRELLHTIGNLTIVTQEWNSSLSNSTFVKKKERFQKHALLINRMYFQEFTESWNSESILQRTNALTGKIVEIWPSIGEPPVVKDMTGQKPLSLVVLGESYEVNSWRDVAFQMAETISELIDNFEYITEELSTFFTLEERLNSKQMTNGWWVYLKLSANSVMSFCERLIMLAELDESDWSIVIEES